MIERKAASAIETVEKVLGNKIRLKKKELAQWQSRREEAVRNEEECLREISEMEMAIAVFRKAIGLEAEAPPTDEIDVLRFRSQTVAESCGYIMSKSGGRARVTDILRMLLRAGKLKNYRSGYATITKTLDRDGRFRRVGKGEFALAATYPDELR
jgi:hypothetical protein